MRLRGVRRWGKFMSALPQNYKTIGLQGNDKTTYNMFGSRTAAHMLMTLNVASSFGGICMLHLAQSFCLCQVAMAFCWGIYRCWLIYFWLVCVG